VLISAAFEIPAGFYYYRARYYDPQARQFLSEDPIGLDGGINLYAYVGNDPIQYIDPEGQDWKKALDEVVDFTLGVGRGIGSSVSFGKFGAPQNSDSGASLAGQLVGTSIVGGSGVTAVQGGIAGGIATSPTLGGAAIGAGVSALGVGAVAGAAINSGAIIQCSVVRSRFGSNQRQNKVAHDARKEAERNTGKKFTPAQERKFHDEITGQGISDYHELVRIAGDVLKGLL
jgi:RHS repeat-associated protein